MLKYIYLFIIVLFSIAGAFGLIAYKNNPQPTIGDVDYLFSVQTPEDFERLKGEPLSNTFSNVESIKITYDIKRDIIYFINSTKYRYHFDFCTKVLGYYQGLEIFNAANYSKSGAREYYLANLNYFKDLNAYALEFAAEDQISPTQAIQLLAIVKDRAFFGDSIKLFINTNHFASLDKSGMLDVPKIYPADIYGKQQFQAVNEGTCYGFLRVIDNLNENYNNINSHDIIVINGSPLSLPVCAGVLTDVFQTPLSHVNVLCHNRKIPSAAQINLRKIESINKYADQMVKMIVTTDSFFIQPVSEKEAKDFWIKTKSTQQILLTADLEQKELLPISKIKNKNREAIGSKAFGFSLLYDLQITSRNAFYTPEGAFTIPFYFYHDHILQPAIAIEINRLLTDTVYLLNNDSLKTQLKKIRKAIITSPISKELLVAVETQIRNNNAGNSYRFRSSSNAEDLEGFNGAGLYDSKTGILNDTSKTISKAIKEVWASVWTLRAFQERNLYNIDNATVMMGILVHRNFPEEKANGVAITRNLYRKNFPGFTINVQKDEVSVVAPPENITCDQFVCFQSSNVDPLNNDIVSEYITYSSLNNSFPVLTDEEISRLYEALDWVKNQFYYKPGYKSQTDFDEFAVDVEFKFDKNGKLYFKQARPYN